MIALDGRFFRADVDGAIDEVAPGRADAVRGRRPASSRRSSASSTGRSTTRRCWRALDELVPAGAASCAVRLDGRFELVRARSVPRQEPALPAADRGRRRAARLRARRRRRHDGRLPLPRLRRGDRGRRLPPALHQRGPRAAAATSSTRAPPATRARNSTPPSDLHVELPPAIELGDPELAAEHPRRDRPGRAAASLDTAARAGEEVVALADRAEAQAPACGAEARRSSSYSASKTALPAATKGLKRRTRRTGSTPRRPRSRSCRPASPTWSASFFSATAIPRRVDLRGDPAVEAELVGRGEREAGVVFVAGDVVGLDRVEALARADVEAASEVGASSVEAADVEPALVGEALVALALHRLGKRPASGR